MGARKAGTWPSTHGPSGLLPSPASRGDPALIFTKTALLFVVAHDAQGAGPWEATPQPPTAPQERPVPLPPPHSLPPSPLCGKEAAGAGVAAGASCPCDRAERGIRGHVGKTLVPAALPARNAPPAPQPPPAWPRNGDSPAPCSHPLIAHPPQPTTGLATGFPASLSLLGRAGPATCLAHPPFQSLPISYNTERDRTFGGVLRRPSPGLSILWSLALVRTLRWALDPLAVSLTPVTHLGPHTQHEAWSTGQVQKKRSQCNLLGLGSCGEYCSSDSSSVTLE